MLSPRCLCCYPLSITGKHKHTPPQVNTHPWPKYNLTLFSEQKSMVCVCCFCHVHDIDDVIENALLAWPKITNIK